MNDAVCDGESTATNRFKGNGQSRQFSLVGAFEMPVHGCAADEHLPMCTSSRADRPARNASN